MTFKPVFPHPCIDCGVQINSPEERYKSYRRCRPCGLAEGRAKQQRVKARKRGEDVPLRKFGPPATAYPFPCKRCGVLVNNKSERGANWHLCKPCLRERNRLKRVQERYGLTPEQMSELEVTHEGICAICGQEPTPVGLVVDHCHKTGKVRGLLCLPCNWMLGNAKDDPDRLNAGAAYLVSHWSADELIAALPESQREDARLRLNWKLAGS